MNRLIEKIVFWGFVTCWRFAGAPTSRWPSFANATTDGVVLPPSAFGITAGSPPSITATHELVVPRSIPIVLAISGSSSNRMVRKSKSDDINSLVGLATCNEVPELDEDGPALLAALSARGVEGVPAVWDSPEVDWERFELVVVRSTWDYAERRSEFLDWAARLPRVLNPLPVLRWSTDKRYLAELEAAGVPIVPTRFLEPGEAFEPPDGRFVVKPVFSAGGRASARYEPEGAAAAAAHVEALHGEGRAAMVQPHVDGVETAGEIALIFLGGTYSHAVRKRVSLRDGEASSPELYLEEEVAAAEPEPEDLRVAEAAIAAAPFDDDLLYARVDLVHDPDPLVLELELAEPSLYLSYEDGAAARLAGLVADALAADG